MTSPITDERLKEILDGCEGVTPGPWLKSGSPNTLLSPQWPIYEVGSPTRGIAGQMFALDACHIARLDPATVAAMASELLAAREALSNHVAAVEQAFRDGLEYATNVTVVDPDLAWQTSRARALLGNRSGN